MRRRSKYGVDLSEEGKIRRTYKGITFRSQAERRYAEILELRVRAGEITSWQYEPLRVPVVVNGDKIWTYVPDFFITLPDGRTEVHEVKGFRGMANWPLKEKLLRATWLRENPHLTYRVITPEDQ